MKDTVKYTKKSSRSGTAGSPAMPKTRQKSKDITDDDIRRRAYELYLESGDDWSDELDNWLNAERELRGD